LLFCCSGNLLLCCFVGMLFCCFQQNWEKSVIAHALMIGSLRLSLTGLLVETDGILLLDKISSIYS
jgi:hypothetical protein